MSQSPRSGRLRQKAFRLSDIPEPVRVAAARRCIDAEARNAVDPISAAIKGALIDAVARDPARAALEFPDECQNVVRVVSIDEWNRVTRGRR